MPASAAFRSLRLPLGFVLFSLLAFLSAAGLLRAEPDESWRSSSRFEGLLRELDAGFVRVEAREALAKAQAATLLILRSESAAPSLDLEVLEKGLRLGYDFLLFDESSLADRFWQQRPQASRSQQDPVLAYINGNPRLVVLEQAPSAASRAGASLRLAFNHASPLRHVKVQAETEIFLGTPQEAYGLRWSAAADPDLPAAGTLYLVRDQSQPSNLMLQTLDNQRYWRSFFEHYCHQHGSCHFRLYVPNLVPQFVEQSNFLSQGLFQVQEALRELEARWKQNYARHQKRLENLPWQSLTLVLLFFCLALSLLFLLPLTRRPY